MKRLDHAELHAQLHDALRLEAASIPAAVDANRLAASLADHLARYDVFDPEGGAETEEGPALPLDLPEVDAPAPTILSSTVVAEREPFSEWLLRQSGRTGWIGDLARSARTDPGYPRRSDVDEVRKRLQMLQAPGDVFEALDDAELDWLAL